jgi:amino-acid N-acetyltransferase
MMAMSDLTVEQARPEALAEVEGLLRQHKLPLAGLRNARAVFVAYVDGRAVGSAALEVYGRSALLRSVAVDAVRQGKGVGGAVVEAALAHALELGVEDVYLLTTTAADYFARIGFTPIERTEVPEAVRASREFSEATCSSAQVMRLVLQPPAR